jgi:hypothetical protein
MYLDARVSAFTANVHFPRHDFYEKTSSNDRNMRRTSYVRSRSRMHECDFVVNEFIRYCKSFISSSNRNAHANRDSHANRNAYGLSFGRSDKFDGALLL